MLVGLLDWVVEFDECWVIVGFNGVGKMLLLCIVVVVEYLLLGVVFVFGEWLGWVDVLELCVWVGFSFLVLVEWVFGDECVCDFVVFVGYVVLGWWCECYEVVDYYCVIDMLESLGVEYLVNCIYGILLEGECK